MMYIVRLDTLVTQVKVLTNETAAFYSTISFVLVEKQFRLISIMHSYFKKKVSMIKKYYNHILETNP